MPATPTGRGAQVVLDSDAQAAARGAAAPTFTGNVAAMATLIQAGIVSDGTGPDGTTTGGFPAADYVVTVGAAEDLRPPVGNTPIGTVGAANTPYSGYRLSWGDDFDESQPQIISPATPWAKYFDIIPYTTANSGQSPRVRTALTNYDVGQYESGHDDINRGRAVASWQDCRTQANSWLSMKLRHAVLNETLLTGLQKQLAGAMITSCGVMGARPPCLIEARVRATPNLTALANFHPSFWAMLLGPVSSGNTLEIDWESTNAGSWSPVGYTWNIGDLNASGNMTGSQLLSATLCPNLMDGNPHVLGMEVLPSSVRMWCDGVLVSTMTQDMTVKGPRPLHWMLTCHCNAAAGNENLWGARQITGVATWGNAATTLTMSTSNAGIVVGMQISTITGGGIPAAAVVTALTGSTGVTFTGFTTTAAGTALPVTFTLPSGAVARESLFEADWVRVWHGAASRHRAPLAVQPDFAVDFGASFSIALPPASAVWGDGTVDETMEMIPHSMRAPGGNFQGMFLGLPFPPSVTYSGGVLAGRITDQPGTMWFVRSGTKPGDTCEVQRWRGTVGPRIMTPANINMNTGAAFAYDFYLDCDVGDLLPLTLSVSNLPAGLTYIPAGTTNGTVTGTPTTTPTAVMTLTNCVGQTVTKSVTMGPRTPGSGTPLPANFFPNFASNAAAGLIGSLDFDDDSKITTATGISAITGSDGTTYTATQATGAAQPTRVTVNNCRTARFTSAGSQYLVWDTLVPASTWVGEHTLFVVARLATAAASQGLLDIGVAAGGTTDHRSGILAITGANLVYRVGAALTFDWTDGVALDTTTTHATFGRLLKAPAKVAFFNKDKRGPNYAATGPLDGPGFGATVDTITVGGRRAGGTYGLFADANIFRVMVFNRFIEDYEINMLASWASATFGTP